MTTKTITTPSEYWVLAKDDTVVKKFKTTEGIEREVPEGLEAQPAGISSDDAMSELSTDPTVLSDKIRRLLKV